jgi:hypothetical protein
MTSGIRSITSNALRNSKQSGPGLCSTGPARVALQSSVALATGRWTRPVDSRQRLAQSGLPVATKSRLQQHWL